MRLDLMQMCPLPSKLTVLPPRLAPMQPLSLSPPPWMRRQRTGPTVQPARMQAPPSLWSLTCRRAKGCAQTIGPTRVVINVQANRERRRPFVLAIPYSEMTALYVRPRSQAARPCSCRMLHQWS